MTIIQGNCLEEMRKMQDNSIDCILTDPPYGLKFMNKKWDHGIPGVEIWKESLRVCKPGSMMLAFGGTRTYHRLACAIEDAGWEVRDCLQWIYGSGFPKSLDVSKAIDKAKGEEREVIGTRKHSSNCSIKVNHGGDYIYTKSACDLSKTFDGYGTALKPAYEPILLCMKPLDGTFAQNAEKWGLAGINVDACRIGTDDNTGRPRGPQRTCYGKFEQITTESHPQVRWPANVIFDEESAAELDQQSGFSKSSDNKNHSKKQSGDIYGWSGCKNKYVRSGGHNDSGGASRFFYCPKASSRERGESNNHPTVKPIKLLEYLLKLIVSPNKDSIVLDPFMGSGSTLIAAKNLGINAIGIEIEKDYCEIANTRLEHVI